MMEKPATAATSASAVIVVPPRKRGRPKTKVEDATPKPKLLDKLRAATENEASSEPAVYASTTKVTQHVRNCGPQMFLISRKGGTLLTINNFVYRSNLKFFGKSNNILYWECVQNRSVKCRSRLKTIGDDLYVTNDVHNHIGDNKRIEAAKAAGMLIHKKLSSLTAADKIQGTWKMETTEANLDPLPKM